MLDRLDPALEAGLVREEGIGSYLFGHALVRDAIYGSFSATRRARAHARVAEVLEGMPDRESETARHWLAAGPSHAGRAWRAARSAGGVARRMHAHDPAAELLAAALETQSQDPDATLQDRYDLLMDLADAHRWRGAWADLLEAVEQAIETADEMDDVRLLARASSAMTIGALWQSAGHGETHDTVVAALRRALEGLPTADDPLRCRAMLGLANELYYSATFEERRALVEQALAMARRLGDDALVLDACEVGFVSLWRPDTAELRLELASEAMAIASRLGNERAFVVAATLTAVAHGECGHLPEMWKVAAEARDQAERLHLPYGLVVLDTLELPWLVMAGRFEEGEAAARARGSARRADVAAADRGRRRRRPDHAAAVAGSRRRDRARAPGARGRPDPDHLDRAGVPPPVRRPGGREGARCRARGGPGRGRLVLADELGLCRRGGARSGRRRARRRGVREARAVRRSGGLGGLRERAGTGRRVPGACGGGRRRPSTSPPATPTTRCG